MVLIVSDWLCKFNHLICLIRLCPGHLHITSFWWWDSLKFGVITFMRLLAALNRLVDIRLVILCHVYSFFLSGVQVIFNLVKPDDCGLILRWFMLFEGRIKDLVGIAFFLKLFHFLIT